MGAAALVEGKPASLPLLRVEAIGGSAARRQSTSRLLSAGDMEEPSFEEHPTIAATHRPAADGALGHGLGQQSDYRDAAILLERL
jgi:hypothetical protein